MSRPRTWISLKNCHYCSHWSDDGLVRVEGRVVTATDTGRQVVRVIAAVFDPHMRVDAARFSKAV